MTEEGTTLLEGVEADLLTREIADPETSKKDDASVVERKVT